MFLAVYSILLMMMLIMMLMMIGVIEAQNDAEYWRTLARKQLDDNLNHKPIEKRAKNVIIFVGDGMGLTTVTAGRIFMGQLQGKLGEEHVLNFEKFPNVALSKTYNTDKMVPDSAGTATAIFCGVKTISGAIGVDSRVERGNCASQQGREVDSILKWSLAAGKRAGIVTSTSVTHATPAALYAHVAERGWEATVNDKQLNTLLNGSCKDIARQLVEDNPDINVVLGGGRGMFFPVTARDPQASIRRGMRMDNKDLIAEWQKQQQQRGHKYKYVWDWNELRTLDITNIDYLLGLMAYSHLDFEIDRRRFTDFASLADLTKTAIQILQKEKQNGFFLMVEGGRIDQGHHNTKAIEALWDMVAFEDAIQTALGMTNLDETLIIVTADHSHVFTIGGYPKRGTPILGLSDFGNGGLAADKMTFTILSYANGPNNQRRNITKEDTANRHFMQQAMVPNAGESHGGEDVGIFAQGPMAHLFRGVVEQNYIAFAAAYASRVGPYASNYTVSPTTTPTASPCNPASDCDGAFNGESHSTPYSMLLFIIAIGMSLF